MKRSFQFQAGLLFALGLLASCRQTDPPVDATLTAATSAPADTSDESGRIRKFESSLLPALNVEGEPQQRWTLQERMQYWKVPGMSIAVIRNGKLAWAKGYGVLQAGKPEPVDTQTVFSVGSVSKVGGAATTLRLVDAGKLDLDRDVNQYLTRWKVPQNRYTAVRPVTLRGILSHTAGLTVHGFPDFQPDEKLPTVIDTLEGRAPAKTEPVRVVSVPGSKFEYSGGGITLEQLVVEEASGLDFPQAARQYVFEPLGMSRSTYENPLPESLGNIAKAHGPDGEPRALPRGYEAMPEMAASGLWTTPSDYARMVIAFMASYRGEPDSFLSQGLAHQMLTEVTPGAAGLGPFLEGEGAGRRFSHGGSNDSYKAHMEGHPNTGDGVVVFTNGANGSQLIAEVVRAVAVAEDWAPAFSNYAQVRSLKLSPEELQAYVGDYAEEGKDGMQRKILYQDGNLYSVSLDYKMVPIDASYFVLGTPKKPEYVRFLRDYSGKVVGQLRETETGVVRLEKTAAK